MVIVAVMMFSCVCAAAESAECRILRNHMRGLVSACREENTFNYFETGHSTICFNMEENAVARELFAR